MKKFIGGILLSMSIFLGSTMSAYAADLEDVFSAKYYADTYEDLYEAFEYDEDKLLNHFKEYGLKEGRSMSPVLDVVYYRASNPDLDAAFGDDWDAYVNHYFEYGIEEGRDNGTNFDPIRYVNSYADLRIAFDDDYEALCKHYITYGINENRTMALKPVIVAAAPATSSIPTGTVYDYDDNGNVIVAYNYDANGNITSTYLYDFNGTGELLAFITYTYNSDGEMSRADQYLADGTYIGYVEYSYGLDGSYTVKDYDADGNLMYTTVYDALDRVIKETNDVGQSIEYTYVGDTEVVSVKKDIWPEGNYCITEYNTTIGKQIVSTDYNADGTVNSKAYYTYTSNGVLEEVVYKDANDNVTMTEQYNSNEQRTKVVYASGDYFTYEYTADTITGKYYYADDTLASTTVYDNDWNIISST